MLIDSNELVIFILNLLLLRKTKLKRLTTISELKNDQLFVLIKINELTKLDQDIFLTKLSDQLHISKSKLSKILNQLVKMELIEKTHLITEDNRLIKIRITHYGVDYIRQIFTVLEPYLLNLFVNYSNNDLKSINNIMTQFFDTFENSF